MEAGRQLISPAALTNWLGSALADPLIRQRLTWGVFGVGVTYGVARFLHGHHTVRKCRDVARRKREQRDARLKAVEDPSEEDKSLFLEISSLSVAELLKKLQSGEVTAVDALRCYIFFAKKAHEQFNCLADVLFDEAMKQAKELDEILAKTGKPVGSLHGLPISIKDNIGAKGGDATVGVSKNCFIERDDAVLVQALKEAGAVIFAKTNVPQTLLTFETSNPVWGRAFNPWNKERTPGGSSGGEAALLAAGGSPVGIGSDVGGSVRIPCHFCGIYGLKATGHRTSTVGAVSSVKGQEAVLSSFGPMGVSTEALASVMRVLWSDQQFAKDLDCGPPLRFSEEEYQGEKPLRIGYYASDGWFEPSEACKRAVTMAVDALKARGHEVIEFQPPDIKKIVETYYYLMTADGGAHLTEYLKGEEWDPLVTQMMKINTSPALVRGTLYTALKYVFRWDRLAGIIQQTGPKSASDVWKKQWFKKELKRELVDRWKGEKIDVLITPGLTTPAIPHNFAKDLTPSLSYTMVWNLLDFPAGTAPITRVTEEDLQKQQKRTLHNDLLDRKADQVDQGSEGLPVAVQVVALPWHDELALRVMRELEDSLPFKDGELKRSQLIASYLA